MKPALFSGHPSSAEASEESPGAGPTDIYPLAIDVLREAVVRLPTCRTLSELLTALNHCATLLAPRMQAGFMLRQPDACFELVFGSPIRVQNELRDLSDHLIETGDFARAVRQGEWSGLLADERTFLLQSIANSKRIHGMAIWIDHAIPSAIRQPLAILADLTAQSLERMIGSTHAFPLPGDACPAGARQVILLDEVAIPADQLTGLAHRTSFVRFLQRAILNTPKERTVGTLLLDVDGFHRVNREFGCEAGDRVLRDVAFRLECALRSPFIHETMRVLESDICLARTGADEFGLAIAHLRHPHRLLEIASHLQDHLAEGFRQHGARLYLSVSIGIASAHETPEPASAQTLLRSADTALKRAKSAGRNQHVVYQAAWNEFGSTHLRTEMLLQEALRDDRFELHYQPLFRLADSALSGAEVLLRLRLGDGAPVPPSSFIPVAESTGQIVEIGEWVLRKVCRQIHVWDALGYPRLPLSVNVSAIELSQTDLAPRLGRILEEEGVPTRRLHIEITETAIARNEAQALANIRSLRAAGFDVWIDDFGTGYSSLKSIKNFPVSGIKLDREFVRDLAQNPTTEVIANSILSMAQQLGYPVVAEGIETVGQFQFLQHHGCHAGQGFHLGRPVCAEVFQTRYFKPGSKAVC